MRSLSLILLRWWADINTARLNRTGNSIAYRNANKFPSLAVIYHVWVGWRWIMCSQHRYEMPNEHRASSIEHQESMQLWQSCIFTSWVLRISECGNWKRKRNIYLRLITLNEHLICVCAANKTSPLNGNAKTMFSKYLAIFSLPNWL